MHHLVDVLAGGHEGGIEKLAFGAWAGHGNLHDFMHTPRIGIQHEDAIRQIDRLVEIVGNEHDGDVDVLPDIEQISLHLAARLGVQGAEGLVHEEDTRLVGQCAGNGHALFHAT